MNFEYPPGATQLSREEMEGLIPPHIRTRDELNEWEQAGIVRAELGFFNRRNPSLLSEAFIMRSHKQMFKEVWKWAGKYRLSDKNIGVPYWEISVKVRSLCEDALVWIANPNEDRDEIAARFHHKLVSIHPFPNGNGRHARMMADLLLVQILGRPRFTWGREDLVSVSATRDAYLNALRCADKRDIGPLIAFVRT